MMQPLGNALQGFGRKRSLVISGEPGIDEISISGGTQILQISSESMDSFTFSPQEPDIACVPYETIPSGDAELNAATFKALLKNKAGAGILNMVAPSAARGISRSLRVCRRWENAG